MSEWRPLSEAELIAMENDDIAAFPLSIECSECSEQSDLEAGSW
jgi:hypothetical protein